MMETTREIYLDNSATTKVCEEAAKAALELMTVCYGNPSSLHTMGVRAETAMTRARRIVAQAMGAQEKNIVFTSGGTESNNLALFGAAYARQKRGKRIVTTAVEHHSVLYTAQQLEKEGFEVIYLKPRRDGHIREEDVFEAINRDTILVSMMAVNNETGAIFPVEAAAAAIKRAGAPALLHVDAVQAFGKLPLRPAKMGIDLMSISGHKIHAPKGIGALYIGNGVHLVPRVFGGGQEYIQVSAIATDNDTYSLSTCGIANGDYLFGMSYEYNGETYTFDEGTLSEFSSFFEEMQQRLTVGDTVQVIYGKDLRGAEETGTMTVKQYIYSVA